MYYLQSKIKSYTIHLYFQCDKLFNSMRNRPVCVVGQTVAMQIGLGISFSESIGNAVSVSLTRFMMTVMYQYYAH